MNLPLAPVAAALALLFGGCAAFDRQELAYLSRRGVPPQTVRKMSHGDPLTPPEIIELTRRRVPEPFILRHLEDAGVNYVVTRNDVERMRAAGVSARVIDAMLAECDRFARGYAETDGGPSDYWWIPLTVFGAHMFHAHVWWDRAHQRR